MLDSIKIQWQLRKVQILGYNGIFLAVLFLGQMGIGTGLLETSPKYFYIGLYMWLIFYMLGKMLFALFSASYLKGMYLGFSATRKEFAGSMLFVTFLEYLTVAVFFKLTQYLSEFIWLQRFGTQPDGGGLAMGYFIFAVIALPFLEMFTGMCYDRFGMKAVIIYFILQGSVSLLSADTLSPVRMILSGVFSQLPMLSNGIIAFVIILICDYLMVRKCAY